MHGRAASAEASRDTEPLIIGRLREASIPVGTWPVDPYVSRQHVRIGWSDGSWWVENLSTQNPIEVYQLGWLPPRQLDPCRAGRDPMAVQIVSRWGQVELPSSSDDRHLLLFEVDHEDLPRPAERSEPHVRRLAADPGEVDTSPLIADASAPTREIRLTPAQLHATLAYLGPYLALPRPQPLAPRTHEEVRREFFAERSSLRAVNKKVGDAGGPKVNAEVSEDVALWLIRYELLTPDDLANLPRRSVAAR
jgi:hypothetical protein